MRFYTPVTPLSTETITNGLPYFCHVGALIAQRPSPFPLFILVILVTGKVSAAASSHAENPSSSSELAENVARH